eukprot:6406957-Amphidinium_carterae.1
MVTWQASNILTHTMEDATATTPHLFAGTDICGDLRGASWPGLVPYLTSYGPGPFCVRQAEARNEQCARAAPFCEQWISRMQNDRCASVETPKTYQNPQHPQIIEDGKKWKKCIFGPFL